MISLSRFGIRRLKRTSRKFVLPWLIPSYLFIGSYAARTIIDLFEDQQSVARHSSDDPDGSNQDSNRPFWTNHKHIVSDDPFRSDNVALVEEIRFEVTVSVYPNFLPAVPPVPFAQCTKYSVERAPPLSLITA